MPTSMVLRFRDLGTKNTISEHQKLIKKHSEVWWGWWHKPSEGIPRNTFAQFSEAIESEGYLEIYLVDSGNELLYKATLNRIDISSTEKRKKCPEPNKTPSYYSTQEFKAWFRLTSIERVPPEKKLKNWSYDEITDFLYDPLSTAFQDKRVYSIQEMLNRPHRTIYFIKPHEQQHKDYLLEFKPPIKPGNFLTDPIFSNSTYILHLSDLHFSTHHHGFSLKNDGIQRSFGLHLIDDIRQKYDDVPAAVIVSGDLTWQGETEEFDLAYDFIRMLQSTFDLNSNHFVIIPGNHDIQWGKQDKPEYDRTKPVERSKAEAEQNYRTFFKKCFGLPPTDFLSMGRRYVLGNYISVDIVGLNSSRLEQRHFAGYGYVSSEQVQGATKDMGWKKQDHPSKYRMFVLHHHVIPVASIEDISNYDKNYSLTLDAGQLIYEALTQKIDLVAHGHMHQPFVSSISRDAKKTNFSPAQTLTVHGAGSAGAKRGDLGAIGKNSYSIYEFDEKGITIKIRSWSENIKGFEEDWPSRLCHNSEGGLKLERMQGD